jgi:hypothetical protein
MKWFALIVLGIAIAAALVSGLPFASGHADGEEASRFIDVEFLPAPKARPTQIAGHPGSAAADKE